MFYLNRPNLGYSTHSTFLKGFKWLTLSKRVMFSCHCLLEHTQKWFFFFASLGTMYGVTDHLQPTLRIYLSLERMDHCVHHVAIFFSVPFFVKYTGMSFCQCFRSTMCDFPSTPLKKNLKHFGLALFKRGVLRIDISGIQPGCHKWHRHTSQLPCNISRYLFFPLFPSEHMESSIN